MNCMQATLANVTDDLIKDVVEEELAKYNDRKGLCKDLNNATCVFGTDVPKPFTRRLYQVGKIV